MGQKLIPLEQTGMKRTGGHRGGRQQLHVLDEPGRRLILAKYDGKTETIDELCRQLCVPRWKVKYWACDLGLTRQKEPRWTEEEIAYLERNLHTQSLGKIAKHLGRTKVAVRLKAKRLGVNKIYQEGYTMKGLCVGLGCDHHKVERWIANGWLKGRRRESERTHSDFWYFTDTDIRALIASHPLEIDPRRADWLWLVDILLSGNGQKGLGELANPATEKEIAS